MTASVADMDARARRARTRWLRSPCPEREDRETLRARDAIVNRVDARTVPVSWALRDLPAVGSWGRDAERLPTREDEAKSRVLESSLVRSRRNLFPVRFAGRRERPRVRAVTGSDAPVPAVPLRAFGHRSPLGAPFARCSFLSPPSVLRARSRLPEARAMGTRTPRVDCSLNPGAKRRYDRPTASGCRVALTPISGQVAKSRLGALCVVP